MGFSLFIVSQICGLLTKMEAPSFIQSLLLNLMQANLAHTPNHLGSVCVSCDLDQGKNDHPYQPSHFLICYSLAPVHCASSFLFFPLMVYCSKHCSKPPDLLPWSV